MPALGYARYDPEEYWPYIFLNLYIVSGTWVAGFDDFGPEFYDPVKGFVNISPDLIAPTQLPALRNN